MFRLWDINNNGGSESKADDDSVLKTAKNVLGTKEVIEGRKENVQKGNFQQNVEMSKPAVVLQTIPIRTQAGLEKMATELVQQFGNLKLPRFNRFDKQVTEDEQQRLKEEQQLKNQQQQQQFKQQEQQLKQQKQQLKEQVQQFKIQRQRLEGQQQRFKEQQQWFKAEKLQLQQDLQRFGEQQQQFKEQQKQFEEQKYCEEEPCGCIEEQQFSITNNYTYEWGTVETEGKTAEFEDTRVVKPGDAYVKAIVVKEGSMMLL